MSLTDSFPAMPFPAGSDHTLNMEPIMPDLHARYTNLLPSIVLASRSDAHYNNLWRALSELCGGAAVSYDFDAKRSPLLA